MTNASEDKAECPVYRTAAVTHRGKVRKINEDTICIDGKLITGTMALPCAPTMLPSPHMALVADGMGGHASGEIASAAALGYLAVGWEDRRDIHGWACALQSANDLIYDLMGEQPHHRGMGTTVVGAMFDDGMLIHFNVGDSRAYRLSQKSLVQISHDDSPRMPPGIASARTHMITQSLGGRVARTTVRPHVIGANPLAADEALLLCSDGLTDMVVDEDLRTALLAYRDPVECAANLLDQALLAGGHDNISIIIVRTV